jgi:hypothetical protein
VPFGPSGPAISSWPNFSATVIRPSKALTFALIDCWLAVKALARIVRTADEGANCPLATGAIATMNTAAKPAPNPKRRPGLAQTT